MLPCEKEQIIWNILSTEIDPDHGFGFLKTMLDKHSGSHGGERIAWGQDFKASLGNIENL